TPMAISGNSASSIEQSCSIDEVASIAKLTQGGVGSESGVNDVVAQAATGDLIGPVETGRTPIRSGRHLSKAQRAGLNRLWRKPMKTLTYLLATTGLAVSLGGAAMAQDAATVAFLMPDQASTRYEQHDYPGFKAEMEKLCASCTVIYQNANADVALQQQQFNSVIAQGAKIVVLDPVDSAAAAALVEIAQSQDVKVIAYDRPIPDKPADY